MPIVLAHPEPNTLLGDAQEGGNLVSRIWTDESQPNRRELLVVLAIGAEVVELLELLVASLVKKWGPASGILVFQLMQHGALVSALPAWRLQAGTALIGHRGRRDFHFFHASQFLKCSTPTTPFSHLFPMGWEDSAALRATL